MQRWEVVSIERGDAAVEVGQGGCEWGRKEGEGREGVGDDVEWVQEMELGSGGEGGRVI